MGRKRGKKPEPEQPPDEQMALADDAEGESLGDRLVPEVGEDSRQRYVRPPSNDVEVMDKAEYGRLLAFVQTSPDASRYVLRVWRCNPAVPGDYKQRVYLAPVTIPEEPLEDRLRREWGGGTYFWRLCFDGGSYVGREDLPVELRDMSTWGYVRIAGAPRDGEDDGGEDAAEMMRQVEAARAEGASAQNQVLELMKEQLAAQRQEGNSAAQAMSTMVTALISSMQQSATAAAAQAAAQNQFLFNLLAHQEEKAQEQRAEKDGMWSRMMDLVREFRSEGGGGPGTVDRLVENLPAITGNLAELLKAQGAARPAGSVPARVPGAFPAASPAAPAAPTAPAAPAAPAASASGLAELFAGWPDRLAKLTLEALGELWRWYGRGKPPDTAAGAMEELDDGESLDALLALPRQDVLAFVGRAYAAANGQPAPQGFMQYAETTLRLLTEPEEPEAPAPAPAPATAPAPAPAPEGRGSDA